MAATTTEVRIGIIVDSRKQIPLAQELTSTFCKRFNLSDKYQYDLQLVIEEFLGSLYDNVGDNKKVPFYLSLQEKAVRIIFDISGTGFRPVLAEFSPIEFESDQETHGLIGLTVIKRMVDNIKHIKQADKNEIHFIMYIGDVDFKDSYGFRKRYPALKKNIIISEIKTEDKTRYNLKLKDKDEYFSVSDREYFIIQLLNGKNELKDIVDKFSKRCGSISPRSVNRFINTLEKAGFLEPEMDFAYGTEYKEEEVKISLLERILSLQCSIPNVDKIVTAVYKKFKWLFTLPAVMLILLSIGIFFHELFAKYVALDMGEAFREYANNPWIIVMYYCVMLFTVICHEFAHAVTCKRYGGQVNKMGLMLYYFQVCAYADTSDAWLFKQKYKKILTVLNGPLFSLFLASLCLWGYYMLTHMEPDETSTIQIMFSSFGGSLGLHNLSFAPVIADILIMTMTANLAISIFNLMPFIEMDGYYILSDVFNSPNIRMLSMGYVLNFFRRLLKKPPYPIYPTKFWTKAGYTIYGSLCLLFGVAAVAFLIYFFIFMSDVAFHSVFGIFIVVSVILFTLKSIYLKKIQQKREHLQRKIISY